MTLKYDVVVVGAGPAGSATARYAAKGGCNVLMIEKRQEIGSPVRCGEGIARHFLDDIEMPYDTKWVAQEVKGAKIISPAGNCLQIDERHAGNEVGIVLERDAFDKACAKLAAKAGAEIWVKTTAVGLLKDDGRVTGVRVKRLEEEFNIEPDPDFPHYCEFFLGTCAPAGYIWVFPKDECTANVGIGVSLDRLHGKQDIKMYLDAWCKKDPRMKHAQFLDMVTGGVSTCPPIK